MPEFLTMSRRPGIGRKFYEENKEKLFSENRYFFPIRDGVGSAYPGRYYNNLFELDFDSDEVSARKSNLKYLFEQQNKFKLSNTDKNYLDYLDTEEYIRSRKNEILKRNKI